MCAGLHSGELLERAEPFPDGFGVLYHPSSSSDHLTGNEKPVGIL